MALSCANTSCASCPWLLVSCAKEPAEDPDENGVPALAPAATWEAACLGEGFAVRFAISRISTYSSDCAPDCASGAAAGFAGCAPGAGCAACPCAPACCNWPSLFAGANALPMAAAGEDEAAVRAGDFVEGPKLESRLSRVSAFSCCLIVKRARSSGLCCGKRGGLLLACVVVVGKAASSFCARKLM